MHPLRIAVIGCGTVALTGHIPAIVNSHQARLVGVVDTDLAWAKEVRKRFGADFFTHDYRDIVGRVDAAVIATPNSTHADITCYLLEHGVHVLCEKPAATSLTDAGRMFGACQAVSARLMIGQSRRFASQIQFLHRLIEGGYLQRDGTLRASLGGMYGTYPSRTDFRLQKKLAGGGALMDQGIHLIDMALWIFNDRILRVEYYQAQSRGWCVEHDAEVTLFFSNGGRALIAVSYTHNLDGSLTYTGSDGWVKTGISSNVLEFYIKDSRLCRIAGVQQPVLPSRSAYINQIDHFCEGIRSGDPFIIKPNEIMRGLRVVEECYDNGRAFCLEGV